MAPGADLSLLLIFAGVIGGLIAFGLVGIFVGPVQAASRSLMARLAPPALRTEFFGLYALAGKATAFIGPALVGWMTLAFDSQRGAALSTKQVRQ